MPVFRKLCSNSLGAVVLLGFALGLHAQEPTLPPPPPQPDTRIDIPPSKTPVPAPIPLQFNQHFAGSWSGTLEYLDFSAASADAPHTQLPTTLVMRPSPDGRAINLEFTYDDGPDKLHPGARKMVHEREILAFTADTAILTGTSNAQNQAFAVSGMEQFARTGYGTLVLTGAGKENDQPADFRMTLTLAPGLFTWLKESKPAGSAEPFRFRDQYRFTQDPVPANSGSLRVRGVTRTRRIENG